MRVVVTWLFPKVARVAALMRVMGDMYPVAEFVSCPAFLRNLPVMKRDGRGRASLPPLPYSQVL